VLCATNAAYPVFREAWLESGMHVFTIRGPELELAVVKHCDLVAVHEQTQHECVAAAQGVCLPKERHAIVGRDFRSLPSLAEIIVGGDWNRPTDDQQTCFVNLPGIGLQSAAVVQRLISRRSEPGAATSCRWTDLPKMSFREKLFLKDFLCVH
jgi:ornithine cyclodeaminase/alanine dehydrogenase-like protein (mu-crystallin family)